MYATNLLDEFYMIVSMILAEDSCYITVKQVSVAKRLRLDSQLRTVYWLTERMEEGSLYLMRTSASSWEQKSFDRVVIRLGLLGVSWLFFS